MKGNQIWMMWEGSDDEGAGMVLELNVIDD
jgi:hypothetical protein